MVMVHTDVRNILVNQKFRPGSVRPASWPVPATVGPTVGTGCSDVKTGPPDGDCWRDMTVSSERESGTCAGVGHKRLAPGRATGILNDRL